MGGFLGFMVTWRHVKALGVNGGSPILRRQWCMGACDGVCHIFNAFPCGGQTSIDLICQHLRHDSTAFRMQQPTLNFFVTIQHPFTTT